MPGPREALKADLWASLHDGGVYEADLREPQYHLDGLCEGKRVYINPAPGVVEAVLHELLHRQRPRWGERRVLRESRAILSRMSGRELQRWYRAYQRLAVKRGKPVHVET